MTLKTKAARALLLRTGLLSSSRDVFHHTARAPRTSLLRPVTPTAVCHCGISNTATPTTRVHNIGSQNFGTSPAIQYADSEEQSDTMKLVTAQAVAPDAGRLFAVIHLNGAQRKVTVEDIVTLRSHTAADIGEIIRLNKVMLVGGADFSIVGRPVLSLNMVKVEGCVIEKTLEHTKIIYSYTARKDNSRMHLYKTPLTMVRITKIEVLPLQQ